MLIKFDDATSDITHILDDQEAARLKRTEYYAEALSVEKEGLVFYVMNVKHPDGIRVNMRNYPDIRVFWTLINEQAYVDLLRDGRIGTRYSGASKVNVILASRLE